MKKIIEMAREAGLPEAWISETGVLKWSDLERFAALARADERDRVKEALAQSDHSWGVDWGNVRDIPCASIIKRLPDGGMEVVAVEYGPPKRQWVGLTDDEVYKIAFTLEGEHWKKIADAIEAKLKEKNT